MKQVALLTDFYYLGHHYSLNVIAEMQLGMLMRAGYAPIGIVEETCEPVRNWAKVEIRRLPKMRRSNDVEFYDGWEGVCQEQYEALNEVLDGVDVVITHDLIYQCASMWLNYAARQYASEHPEVVWLNWVHSATPPPVWTTNDARLAPLQRHMPRSKTVYPNSYDIPRVARAYRCEPADVAIVPHATDIGYFLGLHEMTQKLARERDLYSADFIMTYPVRLDRGKQVEHVLHTAAALKRLGKSVRVVVADFSSTGGDKVEYRKWLKALAYGTFNLTELEVTFTSEFDESLNLSCPRAMIRDLMLLSNVFVLPSRTETYSLITQEAALCGDFLVLNFDYPPFRSIFGDHGIFYKFSSNIDMMTGQDGTTNTDYQDIDGYFHEIASRLIYEMNSNDVLAQKTRVRKERNADHVFKSFIEPLFYAFDGKGWAQ